MKGFEDLEVWEEGRNFRKAISELIKTFPKYEQTSLSLQLRSASRAFTLKIAEGYGRFYYHDNIQICQYAQSSLEECKDLLYVAFDEGYIGQQTLDELFVQRKKCHDLLAYYMAWMKRQKERQKTVL
jgi:four helix bundle protein